MASPRTIQKMQVAKVIDHTHEIRELLLKPLSPEGFTFRAGQFVMIHVPTAQEKPALRAYSIASDDRNPKQFRLLFKYVQGGVASEFIWKLQGDEVIDTTGPFGRVFFQEPATEHILMLNTGSGVAQHLSYLESLTENHRHLKIHLFFGVRTEQDIYFAKELRELQARLPHFQFFYCLSRGAESWQGLRGYVQDQIKPHIEAHPTSTTVYLCGNGNMIKDTKAILADCQFDPKRIHAEAFD